MDQGSRTFPPTPLGMRAPSFGVCEKACVFAEDAGRRCGRRGQRSHFRLEDANSIIQIRKKIIFIYWICVFQGIAREVSTSSRVSSSVFLPNTGVFAISLDLPSHFLVAARRCTHTKPEIQCCSDITFFTGE